MLNNSRFRRPSLEVQAVASGTETAFIRQKNIAMGVSWVVMHFHHTAVV